MRIDGHRIIAFAAEIEHKLAQAKDTIKSLPTEAKNILEKCKTIAGNLFCSMSNASSDVDDYDDGFEEGVTNVLETYQDPYTKETIYPAWHPSFNHNQYE
jgi:hypothetical protein